MTLCVLKGIRRPTYLHTPFEAHDVLTVLGLGVYFEFWSSELKLGVQFIINTAMITNTILDMMVRRSRHGTTTTKENAENFRILAALSIPCDLEQRQDPCRVRSSMRNLQFCQICIRPCETPRAHICHLTSL